MPKAFANNEAKRRSQKTRNADITRKYDFRVMKINPETLEISSFSGF